MTAAAACMALLATSARAAEPPPLATFGRLPSLEGVAISPDGAMLAVTATDGENRLLIVRKTDGGKVAGVKLGVAKLRNVQWVYLAIAVFVLLLAVAFFFTTIPEITDADMAYQAAETHAGEDQDLPFRKQYRLFHAAFAQFCYTGSQIAIAG